MTSQTFLNTDFHTMKSALIVIDRNQEEGKPGGRDQRNEGGTVIERRSIQKDI